MKKHTNSILEIYFRKQFDGLIWRIIPSANTDSDEWAVEIRNQESKTVRHAVIDLSVPETKWYAELPFAEWSTQLTGSGSGRLFFHQYRQHELPQPDDLIAADSKTGLPEWVLPHHNFISVLDDKRLLTFQRSPAGLQEKRYYIKDAQPADSDYLNITDPTVSYRAPIRYLPDNIYFSKISSFLRKLTGTEEPVVIDYLEANQFLVLSYYIYREKAFEQWLLVTDIYGSVLYHEKTGERLSGIGIETILFKNNKLVFLTNNNEFTSLNLTQ